jgi:beta-1,4-mannosyltransferase
MRALRILASPYLEWPDNNPILALLYEAMEKQNVEVSPFSTRRLWQGSWDVWHLNWPELLLINQRSRDTTIKLLKFYIKLKIARAKKTKIFWTAHNVQRHERDHPRFERLFWRMFLPNLDGIICLSDIGRKQLSVTHPRARSIPTFIIPHGHYRGAYPDTMSKTEAREALGIPADEFVMAFLGLIRPYKGVVPLIQCFVRARIAKARLLIAGRPIDDAILQEVKTAAAGTPSVKLFLDFVDRSEVQKFLRAADLVVLPYKAILNSGSAMLALSFDRPILAPSLGTLSELPEIVGSDWVRLYESELSPEVMRDAIAWTKRRQIGPNARAPLEDFNWDRIAEATIHAFKSI